MADEVGGGTPHDEAAGRDNSDPFRPAGGAGGGAPPPPCPDCRGSGRVALLTSTRPCAACGGTGRTPTPPAADPPPPSSCGAGAVPVEAARTEYDEGGRAVATVQFGYDARNRLTRVTRTYVDPPAPVTFGYDGDGEPDAADDSEPPRPS